MERLVNLQRMVLCVPAVVAIGCGGSVTIDVPRAAVQSTVEGYFPLESKDFADGEKPISATLSDPKVVFDEAGDRMGLEVRVVAVQRVPTLPASRPEPPAPEQPAAEAPPVLPFADPAPPASGGPQLLPPGSPRAGTPAREEPTANGPPREFDGILVVFGDLAYEPDSGAFFYRNPSIDVESLEPAPEEIRAAVKQIAETMLSKYLDENAVYTLSDEQAAGKAARRLVKSMRVEDGTLKVELGP